MVDVFLRFTKDFFWYDASQYNLAVNKDRPWQLCTRGVVACLVGKFVTESEARSVAEQLQTDKDSGKLPTNLSKWDKHHLLEN